MFEKKLAPLAIFSVADDNEIDLNANSAVFVGPEQAQRDYQMGGSLSMCHLLLLPLLRRSSALLLPLPDANTK